MAVLIVVDTNQVVPQSWKLDSPAWRVALHRSRHDEITLVVPEIVVLEVAGRFKAMMTSHLDKSRDALASLESAGALTEFDPPSLPTDFVETFEATFRETIAASGGEVLVPSASIDVVEIARRAINRQRPFDDSGSGFRDTLIWLTLLDAVRERLPDMVVLVSSDKKAFAHSKDNPVIHPHLGAELRLVAPECEFVLATSLEHALEKIGGGDPQMIDRAIRMLEEMHDDLAQDSRVALVGSTLEIARRGLLRVVSAAVHHVDSHVRSLGTDDDDLILVNLVVSVDLGVEITTSDATPSIHDADLDASIQIEAVFDPTSRELTDLQPILTPLTVHPEVLDLVGGDEDTNLMAWVDLAEALRPVREDQERVAEMLRPVQEQQARLAEMFLPSQELQERVAEMLRPVQEQQARLAEMFPGFEVGVSRDHHTEDEDLAEVDPDEGDSDSEQGD